MAVLDGMTRTHIHFDPADAKHRAVYWKLRTTGRQDPDVRFILEEGFSSVITMMQTMIADHYSKPTIQELGAVRVIKSRLVQN